MSKTAELWEYIPQKERDSYDAAHLTHVPSFLKKMPHFLHRSSGRACAECLPLLFADILANSSAVWRRPGLPLSVAAIFALCSSDLGCLFLSLSAALFLALDSSDIGPLGLPIVLSDIFARCPSESGPRFLPRRASADFLIPSSLTLYPLAYFALCVADILARSTGLLLSILCRSLRAFSSCSGCSTYLLLWDSDILARVLGGMISGPALPPSSRFRRFSVCAL